MQMNRFTRSTGGASTGKTFPSMLSIQSLLGFYNKHPQLYLSKTKALLMAYIGKTTFNIDNIVPGLSFVANFL